MRKILFFMGFLISPFFYGQDIFPTKLPDSLPSKFIIKLDMDSVHYYNEHKKEIKNNNYRNINYISQFNKKEIFESGIIGFNYTMIEEYLNNIVKKLISDELIQKLNIHVYPCLETDVNAYALPNGTILFNIHNFIYLNNESEIAYIIAHEIGHQIDETNANTEWFEYMNSLDLFSSKKRKYELASQNREIYADRLAAEMLQASGYSNKSALSVERLFINLNQKLQQYNFYKRNKYLETHPSSEERMDSTKKWIAKDFIQNGDNYLVDSLLFQKIKNGARLNSTKIALENHDYFNSLELSLEGYLAEKDNTPYPFYISESIRRLFYMKIVKKNSAPFTGIYKNMFQIGLFNILDEKVFISNCIKERKQELQKQRVYTYQKVYDYFINKAIEYKDTEILLTKGIDEYISSKKKKYSLLEEYISSNGMYKNFAKDLINPKQIVQNKSLLIFNNFNSTNHNGKKPVKLYFLENSFASKYDSILQKKYSENCPYKNKFYKYLKQDMVKNYNDAIFLGKITGLLQLTRLLKNQKKLNYLYIDPSIGDFISRNDYSVIQYIDINYYNGAPAGLALAGNLYGAPLKGSVTNVNYFYYNSNKKKGQGKVYFLLGKPNINSMEKWLSHTIFHKKSYPKN